MRLVKFMNTGCVPCQMVSNFLGEKGVDYIEVNALETSEEELIQAYGELGKAIENVRKELSSVPVLVLFDDDNNEIDRVSGFNPSKIEHLLAKLN